MLAADEEELDGQEPQTLSQTGGERAGQTRGPEVSSMYVTGRRNIINSKFNFCVYRCVQLTDGLAAICYHASIRSFLIKRQNMLQHPFHVCCFHDCYETENK